MKPGSGLTADTLFQGRLTLYQQKEGYRFSLDAILLAGLTRVDSKDRVMDLGTGCGVVALILAHRSQARSIVGVELQEPLADLARKNVAANGFEGLVSIEEMDYRRASERFTPESFDLVLANPPYRRLRSGRLNPDGQKALARHEIAASVKDVFASAKHLLPVGGRLAVIYPAARLDHLMVTAGKHGLTPKELTLIHSDRSGEGRLVHLECRKGGGEELRVRPPFFIYDEQGGYSAEMERLYE